ncbi:MAG: 16S rRNA (cytosine(1402)-N(4))-methyltransferase RsmH [Bacteroidota bacterium]|nr:16S rRNA (cytosine(1402)-N(4))-methyltransferase RsmH [Candidatus Kapabacteria bacterium]MDW8220026.1 16S rRNA (cytosine(1402)-N(4))-methyltransferase RsmH [Bacteroidota bacterium]
MSEKGIYTASNASGDYHVPVMLQEACDWLVTNPDGTYIDGTLGGGGHAAEILRRLSPVGHLIAFDEDKEAIEHARERFRDEMQASSPRITICHSSFLCACSIKRDGKPQAQDFWGILLDLGVSSRQLDTGGIGLSYRVNSHLDMRFGSRDKPPASELIATTKQGDLEHILRKYGEEPLAKVIARRIVEVRRVAPVVSTFDLRAIIESCVPQHKLQQTLSRVFQALRIAVNNELEVLEQTLYGIVPRLVRGGRIVVLTYHSLEDRVVKRVFQDLAKQRTLSGSTQPLSLGSCHTADATTPKFAEPQVRILTKKPLVPRAEEISINPRARSAKLRVAEKC